MKARLLLLNLVLLCASSLRSEWINTQYWPYIYRLNGNTWEYAWTSGFWTQNLFSGKYSLIGNPQTVYAPGGIQGMVLMLYPDSAAAGEESLLVMSSNTIRIYNWSLQKSFDVGYYYRPLTADSAMILEQELNSVSAISRSVILYFDSFSEGKYKSVGLLSNWGHFSDGRFLLRAYP